MTKLPDTVAGLFLASATRFPDRVWIRRRDLEISFAEGARCVAGLARRLESMGLARGDRVVLWLDDMLPSILLHVACAHLGVVPVPVSPRFSASFVKRIGDRVDAALVVSDVSQLGPLQVDEGLEWLAARARRVGPDDPCTILQTSGTTGEPKLVVRPHRNWVRYAHYGRFDLQGVQRVLMVAPLTHSMGLHVLATGLSLAAELCVPSAIDTAMPLEDLHALDPTYMVLTPRVLRKLDGESRAAGCRLFGPSVDVVLVAGAPVEAELLHRAVAQGASLGEYYAGSEMSLVALTPRGCWCEGFVGTVLPDVDLRIASDGEILVRSPGAMLGYWNDEEATRAAYTDDGFYRTGDLGELNAGWLRLLGRKRDLFNTFEGSHVCPARTESQLDALPWVRSSLLVGDQKPFIAALIVVEEEAEPCIDPRARPELYQQAQRALSELNRGLEPIEQVARFVLLGRPFGSDILQTVAAGKQKRDRAAAERAYADALAALYHADCPGPHRVPSFNETTA